MFNDVVRCLSRVERDDGTHQLHLSSCRLITDLTTVLHRNRPTDGRTGRQQSSSPATRLDINICGSFTTSNDLTLETATHQHPRDRPPWNHLNHGTDRVVPAEFGTITDLLPRWSVRP